MEGNTRAGWTAAGILGAWEAAEHLGSLDRAMALLWAGGIQDDPAALPLAERDRRLLELRRASFGDELACVVACTDCGDVLEFALSAAELVDALPHPEVETLDVPGGSVSLRPLHSRDLAAAAGEPADNVAGFLRTRVCEGALSLSNDVIGVVDARIAAREAEAELALALACTACGAEWSEVLDVPAHVWTEVRAAAQRLVAEVGELARAFGWAEGDILGLTATRRHAYLAVARNS